MRAIIVIVFLSSRRFCGIPEEDARRLLAVEQYRTLKSKKELSDKVYNTLPIYKHN